MSKEEAIERVEDTIYNHSGYGINHFKKITFYEDGIEDIKIVLNYIKELEYKLKEKICFEGHQQFEELKENSIPKQVIRELKEKIHNTLDKNGITRGYQLEIDNYFDELLNKKIKE